MYLTKKQAIDITTDWSTKMLMDYKSRLLYITNLLGSDDWAFVIKSHSLIESLMNELVIAFLEKDELTSLIEKLPLHDNDASKISIAKKLNIIQPQECKFIERLSRIRNKIVHRFENIDFSFDSYIQTLDSNQIKSFKSSLVISADARLTMEKYYKIGPKWAMWFALYSLIVELIMRTNIKKGMDNIKLAEDITSKEIIKSVIH